MASLLSGKIVTAGKVANSATTATSANTASAIVARDASGNFSAGTITANVTGNVSGSSGSTTGNAATATNLAASTTTLASNVTASSLTSFGTDPTATTQSVDNNSTKIATTAFVLGQAASAAPVMDGTAAVGVSTRYARQDHVHGSDTNKANTNQQMFLGTTAVTINRASAAGLSLAGVSIDGSSGSTTGNAATATRFAGDPTINGVVFNGTANITFTDSDQLILAAQVFG
jgi:hypothetical protein